MSQTIFVRNKTIDYGNWTDKICNFDNILGIPVPFVRCLRNFSWSYNTEIGLQNWRNRYSEPMPWIGMYIAVASLLCMLAMLADLIHGLRNRKLWFPCKTFTLNAASLTVIAVAMKLPVDLNTAMETDTDQAAKIGSMAFMCTMMANLLPSLATMNGNELLTNIIALDILVITLIVNVCIQIYTSAIGGYFFSLLALFYVPMLLILLIIHTCSGLTILKSKQIIELKYQAGHETALKGLELQQPGRLTIEKLKQHVKNHWIMAGTGSPQFITACSATTSASGVICILSTTFLVLYLFAGALFDPGTLFWVGSDYSWSISPILIIQFIGSLVGTIAPLCRCYAALSFKLSIKWIWNHIKVFKVERYWTQKLYDWKKSSIPFSISSRKIKIVIENFKVIFLIICIGLQKTVVVACKMIALIPIFFVIFVLFSIRCWKGFKAMFSASSIVRGQNPEQQENFNDLRRYVLQLQDDMELSDRTLKSISKSVNRLIKKAEKQQPMSLVKLLRESKGFEGVGKYDSLDVPSLFAEEGVGKYDSLDVPSLFAEDYLDCWSLPLVTLTTVAVSLPKIQNDIVDRLLSSVSEGLKYVTLVEESLNAADEYVSIQKAAKVLWREVEVYNKWLGNNLQNHAPEVKTAGLILQWFKNTAKNMVKNTAKNMVTEVQVTDNKSANDNSTYRSICANSMYRITESILLTYHTNIEELSEEDLFTALSSMIADILAACLTNLPQVIVTKCHESVIEKRESSVNATVQLLGETAQIIDNLQDRELPDLDPAELPFIKKWRDYFNMLNLR